MTETMVRTTQPPESLLAEADRLRSEARAASIFVDVAQAELIEAETVPKAPFARFISVEYKLGIHKKAYGQALTASEVHLDTNRDVLQEYSATLTEQAAALALEKGVILDL